MPTALLRSSHTRSGSGRSGGLQDHLDLADRVLYRKGQIIISQGQQAHKGVYWLKSGRVKFSLLTDEGSERVVGFAEDGDSFGEASILDNDGHLVMAQALTDCVIYVFDRAVVLRLMYDDPDLAVQLLRNVSRKLRLSVELLEEMSFCGVRERLAHVIARLATSGQAGDDSGAGPPALRLTHQELASLIGASRVMVTNALAELRREGAIEQGRRRLVIRDLGRLIEAGRASDGLRRHPRDHTH